MALFLSCSNSEPTYTNCIQSTFNFNNEAANRLLESDKKEGRFTIELSSNLVKITDEKGNIKVLNTDKGYTVTNKKSGDTLVVEHLPTENTPSEILKFGSEYKFYN